MSFQTSAELKQAYAKALKAAGRSVSIDVPVGDRGSVDILTDKEIIFCILDLNKTTATTVRSKLDFYGRYSPSWEKVVVVHQITDLKAAATLAERGIQVININEYDSKQLLLSPVEVPTRPPAPTDVRVQVEVPALPVTQQVVYRYPALDSVEGGKGLRAVVAALTVVFLIGGAISLIQGAR